MKLCPKCNEVKLVAQFDLNASRVDGLSYCCKWCRKYGVTDYSKRSLRAVQKTCLTCNRSLPRQMYLYSQTTEDSLTEDCRSCRLYIPRRKPSLAQVEEFELSLQSLIKRAKGRFDPRTERVLFEEFIYKQFHLLGLHKEWKPPLWLNTKLFKDE